MMEFKKLSDVEIVAEPTESANVLIEEDGIIKRAPKTAVGGAGSGVSGDYDIVIVHDRVNSQSPYIESGSYQNVYDKIMVKGVEPKILLKYTSAYYSNSYAIISHFKYAEIVVDRSDTSYHFLALAYDSYSNSGSVFVFPDGRVTDPNSPA